VISSENATTSWHRDRRFIPPDIEKQKLSYDDGTKTFLQYFNKQSEIKLTEHAKQGTFLVKRILPCVSGCGVMK
jgi:hypothetical protein